MVENSLEKVMCIKKSILFEDGKKWNGLKTDNLDNYLEIIKTKSEFRSRIDLEEDNEYKQIVAQVVLKYNGKYFLYKQVNEKEGRLNSLCSILLGGHVRESNLETAIETELRREASVEAGVLDKNFKGILHLEDEKIVNSKHLGLIYEFEIDGNNVHMVERNLENIGFVSMEYLKTNPEKLTYWSKFIIYHL